MKVRKVEVVDITGHGFESHSRRPSECRICKAPAGMHATCADAFQGLWKSLRYPLVTDRFQGYSARTLGVLTAIAAQGGNVDSWDLGNRGWHKTAVSILIKDMIIIELNPDTHPRQYTLSEAGRQVCAWHGIEITETVEVTPVTSTTTESLALPEAVTDATPDAIEAMADAVVSSEVAKVVKRGSAPADIRGCEVRGFYWPALVTAESRGLLVEHNGRFYPVPAPEVTDVITEDADTAVTGTTVAERVARYAKRHHLSDAQAEFMITELTATLGDAWKRAESEIWAGTGTDVRTWPRSFRKIKNTRSNRARRGGAR